MFASMNKILNLRALGVALLLLALAGVVRADGDSLALDLAAPVSGGGVLSGGDYALVGAIGQPVAGALQAGEYSLASGTVPPDIVAQPALNGSVYLPLVQR
jgi:hypothetical protein